MMKEIAEIVNEFRALPTSVQVWEIVGVIVVGLFILGLAFI